MGFSGLTKYYAKFREGIEYEIHLSSKLVTDAFLEWNKITKEQYDNY